MKKTLFITRALWHCAIVIATFALATFAGLNDVAAQSADAGILRAFVDHSQGTNGAIVVYRPADPGLTFWRFRIPPASGYPQKLRFTSADFEGIDFSIGSGRIIRVPFGAFESVEVPLRSAMAPSLVATPHGAVVSAVASAAPVTITTSNDADTFATTCDGRWAVVVGTSSSGTPVSLVDLDAGAEVAKLSYANQLSRDAAIGDDGQTALVGGVPAEAPERCA